MKIFDSWTFYVKPHLDGYSIQLTINLKNWDKNPSVKYLFVRIILLYFFKSIGNFPYIYNPRNFLQSPREKNKKPHLMVLPVFTGV